MWLCASPFFVLVVEIPIFALSLATAISNITLPQLLIVQHYFSDSLLSARGSIKARQKAM